MRTATRYRKTKPVTLKDVRRIQERIRRKVAAAQISHAETRSLDGQFIPPKHANCRCFTLPDNFPPTGYATGELRGSCEPAKHENCRCRVPERVLTTTTTVLDDLADIRTRAQELYRDINTLVTKIGFGG